MNALVEFFGKEIIDAIGWSIFHILWQGFVLAFCLGLVLRLFRNKSSKLRYVLTFISLLAIVGLSTMNFFQHLDDQQFHDQHSEMQPSKSNEALIIDFNDSESDSNSTFIYHDLKKAISGIEKYFPFIVNLWILGVILFAIKFIFGFLYTIRLKHYKTKPIAREWIKKFEIIESKLRIQKSIQYIESYFIKIPLVLGHLKPVVLIPAEMLSGMPSDQIEAVIAHELAHILRNDYIINVLQTIIETVFFFHPAVWYISSQLRKERENCCDDMALTVCKESIVYAKALVSIQELTLNRHYSAVAFSGNKKHLLNRIKRMIMKQKVNLPNGRMKSNITDKIMAAFIIFSGIVALSFTYAAEMNANISEKGYKAEIVNTLPAVKSDKKSEPLPSLNQNETKRLPDLAKDTLNIRYHNHDKFDIKGNTITRTYTDDKGKKEEMKFTMVNGKATDLYVDGKKIPEKDYDKYQPRIDKTIEDLKEAKEDIRKAMKDIEELDIEKIHREVEEAMKNVHVDMAEIQKEIAQAKIEVKEIDVQKMMEDIERSLESVEHLDIDFDDHISIKIEDMDLDIDLEEVRAEMERARESIKENIDMEAIEKEIQRANEELAKIDHEKIRMEIEESLKGIEKQDKEEMIQELEQKLEELENLELEEK